VRGVGGVGADDGHLSVGEPAPEDVDPPLVEFDGDDPGTGFDQRCGQGAGAGSDVEDEVAGFDGGHGDDVASPAVVKRIPSPAVARTAG